MTEKRKESRTKLEKRVGRKSLEGDVRTTLKVDESDLFLFLCQCLCLCVCVCVTRQLKEKVWGFLVSGSCRSGQGRRDR